MLIIPRSWSESVHMFCNTARVSINIEIICHMSAYRLINVFPRTVPKERVTCCQHIPGNVRGSMSLFFQCAFLLFIFMILFVLEACPHAVLLCMTRMRPPNMIKSEGSLVKIVYQQDASVGIIACCLDWGNCDVPDCVFSLRRIRKPASGIRGGPESKQRWDSKNGRGRNYNFV